MRTSILSMAMLLVVLLSCKKEHEDVALLLLNLEGNIAAKQPAKGCGAQPSLYRSSLLVIGRRGGGMLA
jgi:hypothetical protein